MIQRARRNALLEFPQQPSEQSLGESVLTAVGWLRNGYKWRSTPNRLWSDRPRTLASGSLALGVYFRVTAFAGLDCLMVRVFDPL